LLAIIVLCATVLVAQANEGTGTVGFCERHGCGAPEDPSTVVECPNLTCPDVTCEATDCSKTTVVVNPTPVTCPTLAPVAFPRYYPCRQKKDGTFVCPRKKTPRRVFIPATDPASGK
jgi:hypothetical protein